MQTIILINGHWQKKIAALLLFVFVSEILAPNITLALTAGPTSPEATSFEPVDTTDMVNPFTGSFTYNMPLLEVPGPEGGYPLSLSYHAGILPNLEASWTGLGWTLNPGAINRNVNGLPDDFSEVNLKRRDYWSGGSRRSFGLSVGFPNGMSVGLVYAQDTYKGFGLGPTFSYGYGLFGSSSPVGLSLDAKFDPFDGAQLSGGLNGSIPASNSMGMKLSAGIGVETNFRSVSGFAGGGISAGGNTVLGASISTSSSKPSLTIGGGWKNISNVNAGRIQTKSHGFGIIIPLGTTGFTVGLSYRYMRYWSDETATVATNGAVYIPQTISDQSYLSNRTYDIYRLANHPEQNIVDHPDQNQLQGGTFPDFDQYNIAAQGLGGDMRPYIFQSNLFSQNLDNGYVPTNALPVGNMNMVSGIQFRFNNDFSNSYRQDDTNISSLSFPYAQPTYGNNDGNYGYNTSNNTLAGSKSIIYFTNSQINSGYAKSQGFCDINVPGNETCPGFIRMGKTGSLSNTRGGQQIGGFMITNESGVTYHFALPAYGFNEFNKLVSDDGTKYTYTDRNEPYAYTWLLTAITGPDYVDRNNDGAVGNDDWGYWVSFDYGKWTDNYHWRNPATNFQPDLEQGYKYFSRGTKELYYLNSIRTRTHVALFEKEIRLDAKGSANSVMSTDDGNFDGTSANSLRLNKIYLLNASDASLFNKSAGVYTGLRSYDLVNNVLDNKDIDAVGRNLLESKALRIIDFGFDYSLIPQTPNSFSLSTVATKSGRLTLKDIHFRGKNGDNLVPPTLFDYSTSPVVSGAISTLSPTEFLSTFAFFNVGDLIETNTSSPINCGVITSKVLSGMESGFFLFKYTLANSQYTGSGPYSPGLRVTKNPPYNSQAFDIWGMYKSDIDFGLLSRNESLARRTTELSSKSTDAWGLRKITTSLGSNILVSYEPNDYANIIYKGDESLVVNKIEKINSTDLKLTIDNLSNYPYITVGSTLKNALFLHSENVQTWKTGVGGFPVVTKNVNNYKFIRSTSSLNNLSCISITNLSPNTQSMVVRGSSSLISSLFYSTSAGNVNDPAGQIVKSGKLILGNLRIQPLTKQYGGGIRTKNIILDNRNGVKYETDYFYTQTPSTVQTSGTTTYEPIGLEGDALPYTTEVDNAMDRDKAKKAYRRELLSNVPSQIINAREIPVPGVMYQYARVAHKTIHDDGNEYSEGYTSYHYRVFEDRMVEKKILQSETISNNARKNLAYNDFTSNIGDLISTASYDVHNKQLIDKRNHFLYDEVANSTQFSEQYGVQIGSRFNYQGVTEERYGDGRSFGSGPPSPWLYTVTMSARNHFPSILLSQTNTDYLNNVVTTSENLGFDFYSGSLTSSRTEDSYGNRFKTVVFPAYRQYPQMGLKTGSASNKHMLTQEAGSVVYKLDQTNAETSVVSANAGTWSNIVSVMEPNGTTILQNIAANGNVWRMESSYAWMPDGKTTNGLTPLANFSLFNWSTPGSSNVNWKKTGGNTRYDTYSKSLEATDINAHFATTHFGYNNSKVVVTGGQAKYPELVFSGVEDETITGTNPSEVLKGDGTVTTVKAHTGSSSIQLAAGKSGFIYTVAANSITPGRNYVASVWVRPLSGTAHDTKIYYQINGVTKGTSVSSSTSNKTAGEWTLVNLEIKGTDITTGTTLKVAVRNDHAIQVYADDFRFQPVNAVSTAYVYNKQTGELTYLLNNNNLYNRYEYDGMGRLKAVYTEQFGRGEFKIQENEINYGAEN